MGWVIGIVIVVVVIGIIGVVAAAAETEQSKSRPGGGSSGVANLAELFNNMDGKGAEQFARMLNNATPTDVQDLAKQLNTASPGDMAQMAQRLNADGATHEASGNLDGMTDLETLIHQVFDDNEKTQARRRIGFIHEKLKSGTVDERKKAANLLRAVPDIGDGDSISLLMRQLEKEDNLDVVKGIIFALRGLEAKGALPKLLAMLDDSRYGAIRESIENGIEYLSGN